MKKVLFILLLAILPFFAGAQDFIDNLFSKYAGKENFTSIVISKDLLDFAFSFDKQDSGIEQLKGKISDLKILISNDPKSDVSDGFTTEIMTNINKNNYLSLMEILDGKEKVNFYIKKENDKIVHLLLIAFEENEKVILSLKGKFTMKDLAEIGKDSHDGSLHQLSHLKNIDKK